jgi:hypothetical protein
MKNLCSPLLFMVATAAVISTGCGKSAQQSSVAAVQGIKWRYSFYATCPPNPLSLGPCFEYMTADTPAFGNCTYHLQIGPGNKIFRTTTGSIRLSFLSYLPFSSNDSIIYQPIDNSTLALLINGQVTYIAKITSLTNNSLTLKVASLSGYVFETDSLHR